MITRSLCNTCLQPYELLIQPSDVGLVKEIADEKGMTVPCPRLCGGRINVTGDAAINAISAGKRLADSISLTGQELYKAVHGAGLPDEIVKDRDVLVALLQANKITGIDLEEVHGKFYLHEIKLENGVVIHLGASSRGAIVVKITKEKISGPALHP